MTYNKDMKNKQYYVYVLGNIARTVLYTGVTDNLIKRIQQHKNELVEGFTQKYKVHDLLFYEVYSDPESAIEREKQVKSWSRDKKEKLITSINSGLVDLYDQLIG